MSEKPLYEFTSHINGKNAKVQIWPDRVEWDRKAVSGGKVAAGIMTFGTSTLFTGLRGKDTEMIPIRSISSVTSKKGMGLQTVVSIITSSNTIEMRVAHKEADKVKSTIMSLIAGTHAPTTHVTVAAPTAPAAPDVASQLTQLAQLRDAGVLTQDEFDAKKTELLARF